MKSWVVAAMLIVVPALVRGQQLQGARWYTEQTGYDFTTSPMRLFDGTGRWPLFNSISAGTISSASGQLQFFGSSSYQLFNRDYQRLPSLSPWMGGIQEDVEQMALIPSPDNDKLCYVVQTPGPFASMNRIPCLYSVLDTRLDGGRGEFVTPGLRRSLPGKAAAHLTTAMHTNDHDVWVITVTLAGDSLRAWRLGPTGFMGVTRSAAPGTPALMPRGLVCVGSGNGTRRFLLRSSPSGQLLACNTDSTVEMLHFDRTTGQITPWFSLPMGNGCGGTQQEMAGLAFSPDNSKLYVSFDQDSSFYPNPSGGGRPVLMVQYDLSSQQPAAIQASRTVLVRNRHLTEATDMQLGIDGMIYFQVLKQLDSTTVDYTGLCRIKCPNQLGLACVVDTFFAHSPNLGGVFPALNQTLFRNAGKLQIRPATICAGDSARLLAYGAGAEQFAWVGPGGQPVPGAQPRVAPPVGAWRYRVTATGTCRTDTASVVVQVLPRPLAFSLGADRVLTAAAPTVTLTVGAGRAGERVLWNTGDTTAAITTDSVGTYWARVFNAADCPVSDTVRVLRITGLASGLGETTIRLWPNPARQRVQVGLPWPGTLTLLDATGRVVATARVTDPAAPVVWPLAGLPAGIYTMRAVPAAGTAAGAGLVRRLVVAENEE